MYNLRQEAQKTANALLYAANVNKPPIRIDNIINWLRKNLNFNITIFKSDQYLNYYRLSGQLMRRGQNVWILINKNEHEVRQRFTLAHELGHLLDAYQVAHMTELTRNHNPERYANQFASELLMPAELVREEWSKFSQELYPQSCNSSYQKFSMYQMKLWAIVLMN
ncbi:MAG: ImmA/IrrE family metallo-endopeptidase [Patescibacteria group bacterium]|nr:ImmA/IrrE family metallo-endopeptidase [Patescibacteria group bacterium]